MKITFDEPKPCSIKLKDIPLGWFTAQSFPSSDKFLYLKLEGGVYLMQSGFYLPQLCTTVYGNTEFHNVIEVDIDIHVRDKR